MNRPRAPRRRDPRLGEGRPRKDARDQDVVNAAAALQVIVKTGPQQAHDLIVAWIDADEIPADDVDISARSRVFRKAVAGGMKLSSFALPANNEIRRRNVPSSRFKHRAEAIRRKGLRPQPEIVDAYVAALSALLNEDMAGLLRAYLRLFPKLFPPRPRGAPPE